MPPLPATVDELVIGSSPLLLLHAAREAARGKNVMLVERNRVFGGAWSYVTWDGMPRVETGAHYLYCNPHAYAWLVSLGVDLEPMDPPPYLWRGRRRPIWLAHKVGRLMEGIADREAALVVGELGRTLTYGRYRYPRQGAAGLLDPLVAYAHAAGVKLVPEATCAGLDIARGGVHCEIRGTAVRARRVVTGESCDPGRLAVDGAAVDLGLQRVGKTHRLLRVPTSACRRLTYVEVQGHPLLRRVSLAQRPPGDETVLCAEIPRDARADAVACRDALAGIGLVTAECPINASTLMRYRMPRWPAATYRRLHRITTRVRVMPTQTCFGDSLVWYRSRAGRRLMSDAEA